MFFSNSWKLQKSFNQAQVKLIKLFQRRLFKKYQKVQITKICSRGDGDLLGNQYSVSIGQVQDLFWCLALLFGSAAFVLLLELIWKCLQTRKAEILVSKQRLGKGSVSSMS